MYFIGRPATRTLSPRATTERTLTSQMSTESRSEQAFDQTFDKNSIGLEKKLLINLQFPCCGLDGDKESWRHSKSQFLLLTAFGTKVKAANVAHREQRIHLNLIKVFHALHVKSDHLSSTANNK